MAASPLQYFRFGCLSKSICIHRLYDTQTLDPAKPVIIGGGGLCYWEKKLARLACEKRSHVVTWGVGLNLHGAGSQDRYPAFFSAFDLNGVRDSCGPWRYVPCPSCLHKAFDNPPSPTSDIVVFEHSEDPLRIEAFPRMANNCSIETAVRFLAQGDTVITNSYHGVYWATLLGRKVLAIPLGNSSRFYFFRYPPTYVGLDSWRSALGKIRAYNESLCEARELNMKYAADVSRRLGVDVQLRRRGWFARLLQ